MNTIFGLIMVYSTFIRRTLTYTWLLKQIALLEWYNTKELYRPQIELKTKHCKDSEEDAQANLCVSQG